MVSKQAVAVAVLAVAATVASMAPVLAVDLVVGDDRGWGLGVDYDEWAAGNEFIVGDTLVFRYAKFQHTVVEATGAASFAACSQFNSLNTWTSGEDRVVLNATGQRWFFCGVDDHCARWGMKLNITVLPAVKLADPSSTSASPPRTTDGGLAAALTAGAVVAAAFLF